MKHRICLSVAALGLLFGQAHAGSVTNGTWTASGCGAAPQPVTIDQTSEDAFSKSLDANDKYEEASQKFQDCAFKEGAADQQAILAAEKILQDQRSGAVSKNEADIKTGLDKFGKGKKK